MEKQQIIRRYWANKWKRRISLKWITLERQSKWNNKRTRHIPTLSIIKHQQIINYVLDICLLKPSFNKHDILNSPKNNKWTKINLNDLQRYHLRSWRKSQQISRPWSTSNQIRIITSNKHHNKRHQHNINAKLSMVSCKIRWQISPS